jgi:hypothetical protein
MSRTPRHSLIKQLQTDLPRGVPFDLLKLKSLGISAQLAAKYVDSGWLVRIAHGVYAFPADDLNAHGAIKFLASRVKGLHVAGKSALGLQGIRHNVGARPMLVLWGDTRLTLPAWFTSRFPARYVSAHLFNWSDELHEARTLTTPPDVTERVPVSIPERAILELLYEVGRHQGFEEAHNLFSAQRNLRKDLLGRLLACCTSVKTVRLFLTWARETHIIDVEALQQAHRIAVGSNSRWITRLKDGTLLSLKPHG